MKLTRRITPLVLIAVMLVQACGGGNFASQIRSILRDPEPLINSLVALEVIKPAQRDTYIKDFVDLSDAAGSLKDNLDGCNDNACKVDAVEIFQQAFWDIQRRGHFKTALQLVKIEAIIKAIIAAAKAYYAPAPVARATRGARVRTPTRDPKAQEQEIKAKIAELKAAMRGK